MHRSFSIFLLTTLLLWINPARTQAEESRYAQIMRDNVGEIGQVVACRPGPWGKLEFTTVMMEPEADVIAMRALASQPPTWPFRGWPVSNLATALVAAGLSSDTTRDLLATALHGSNELLVLQPSEELLLHLDPTIRYRVYALLRTTSDNNFYRYPFHINQRFASSWLEGVSLEPSTCTMLEQLMYRHGEMVYFSDLRFLLSKIHTMPERRDLAASLLRQTALMVRLTVSNDQEVAALSAYWGQGGRTREVEPLIEAAVRGGTNWPIGVSLLLPPLPRARLYTYQTTELEHFLDCMWSALNFFSPGADDRFLQSEIVNKTIQEDYAPVLKNYRLGDIILLRNRSGQILHSCNYLADNLVFTKNGGDLAQPWIISTLHDVVNYYTINGDAPEFLFLRKKK